MEDEKNVRAVRKKYRKRKILSTVLSAAMVSGLLTAAMPSGSFMGPQEVLADGSERAEADAKPAVIAESADLKYLDRVTLKEGAVSKYGQQEVTFVDEKGLPVSLEEKAEEVSGISGEEMLAGLYSARRSSSNKDKMPEARNQGTWGLCWAFAATGALEANILNSNSQCSSVSNDKSQLDLAERHMGWFAHHTLSSLKGDPTKGLDGVKKGSAKAAYTGGNYFQSTAYLARGSGMALEEDVPYSNSMGIVPEADRYDSVVTLHDSHTITYDISTDEKASNSIQAVKALVDNFGAAGCSYKSVDAYYNKSPNGTAYYQRAGGTNHAVLIVGYDDSFAVSNFKEGMQPEKPGAWLIRNSWGSGWGDDGYFWLSYYDGSLSGIFAYEAADSADYGDIYQYDAAGSYSYMGVNATANVFQARRDDTLKSVGIYTHSAVTGGTIKVYTNNEKMENPEDGTEAVTYKFSAIPYAGYHIIDLKNNTVNVMEKQYFSVVLTLNDEGSTAMYSFEGKKGCKSSAGQSYYLYSKQWNDCYKVAGNTCIKALMAGETDTSQLDELLADAGKVTKDMVAGTGGDALYNWVQKEIKAAQCAKNTGASDDVARAVKRLTEVLSHTGSRKIYVDTAKTKGPGYDGVSMYVNGGSYKKNGVTTKYGAQSLIFSVNKVLSRKPSKGKLVSAYYGNYVAAATTTEVMPALDADGKVENPDEEAAKIVKVKLSGSKVSITPLAEGTVYVWVLYYPKGGKWYESDEDDYAVTKVKVGTAAPTTVKLYDTQEKAENCTDTTITQYLSTVMPEGGSTSVYVAGTSGKRTKKLDTLAASKLDGTHYEPVVPVKYADYIEVVRDEKEPNKITFTAKEGILKEFEVKRNKTLAVTVPVYCIRNSKKVNFKLVIGNPVKEMSFTAGEGALLTQDADVLDVKLEDAKLKASTGLIVEEKIPYLTADRDCTDSTAVLRMAEKDDIVFNASNVLSVSTKLTAEQKKITMALQKDKKTYKITAKKGTAAGTTVYFVIRHNAYVHQSGSGYQIIKVTVGEAS